MLVGVVAQRVKQVNVELMAMIGEEGRVATQLVRRGYRGRLNIEAFG